MSSLLPTVILAFREIRRHLLRSFLTVLACAGSQVAASAKISANDYARGIDYTSAMCPGLPAAQVRLVEDVYAVSTAPGADDPSPYRNAYARIGSIVSVEVLPQVPACWLPAC